MTGPFDRSQSGLDRLLLFVVVVVGLVIVVPYAFGMVGVDVRGPTGAAPAPSDHDLTILAARGGAIDGERSSVGTVRLVVAPNHDRTPVDLRDVSAIWIGSDVAHLATAGTERADGSGTDGTYTASAMEGGGPILEEPTDRGVLRFDVGTDDVGGADEVGRRLAAGDTATVTLVTAHGEHLTRELSVPAEIPRGQDEVWL